MLARSLERWVRLLRWAPPEGMTIDFRVRELGNPEGASDGANLTVSRGETVWQLWLWERGDLEILSVPTPDNPTYDPEWPAPVRYWLVCTDEEMLRHVNESFASLFGPECDPRARFDEALNGPK